MLLRYTRPIVPDMSDMSLPTEPFDSTDFESILADVLATTRLEDQQLDRMFFPAQNPITFLAHMFVTSASVPSQVGGWSLFLVSGVKKHEQEVAGNVCNLFGSLYFASFACARSLISSHNCMNSHPKRIFMLMMMSKRHFPALLSTAFGVDSLEGFSFDPALQLPFVSPKHQPAPLLPCVCVCVCV